MYIIISINIIEIVNLKITQKLIHKLIINILILNFINFRPEFHYGLIRNGSKNF